VSPGARTWDLKESTYEDAYADSGVYIRKFGRDRVTRCIEEGDGHHPKQERNIQIRDPCCMAI
jgi:hypothetical protein